MIMLLRVTLCFYKKGKGVCVCVCVGVVCARGCVWASVYVCECVRAGMREGG